MPKRTIFVGNAFQYEPSTGDLSTTEEFGSILIGQLDKYLSQDEVRVAIPVAVPALWLNLSKCGASFIKRRALLHKGQSE